VDGLGVLREVVPESGRVVITVQVSSGVSLLSVDEVGELCRITHYRSANRSTRIVKAVLTEEDRGVVANHVPISL
jgi:hypothetical protein